jgi:hypothetical protein
MNKIEIKPQKSRKQRIYYDSKFKNKVIRYADEFGNRVAERRYDINEINVRRWKKDRVRLSRALPRRKAFTGPRQGRFPEADDEVVAWINEL